MRFLNFLKSNVAHLISAGLFLTGAVFVIVSFFVPMFNVSYFVSVGSIELNQLELVTTHQIGFNYFFNNFNGWLETGSAYGYSMFIQISLMILVCLGIVFAGYIVCLIFSFLKDKISRKGEFIGASFGIVSVILSVATILLLIIILTATEIGKKAADFVYNSTVRENGPAYVLLIVAAILFIVSGAINTAAISEKTGKN